MMWRPVFIQNPVNKTAMATKTQAPTAKTQTASPVTSVTPAENTDHLMQQGDKKQKTLNELFEEGLKEMYNVEKQLINALPEMAQAAYHEELQNAFLDHLQQTQKHAERLEKIFMRLRIDREEKTCEAMKGLIEEGQQIIREYEESPVRDSALIIGAQKIEHYEIAAYGSLCELAEVLGFYKVADILDRTLEEEELTDSILTELAKDVNDEAAEVSEEANEE